MLSRELAYQIFETLRRIGAKHDFSAGLVIGGKDLKFEWSRVADCNILVCTPGRLLQHLDENPAFSLDQLQLLVLDEADRCLDLGFSTAINSIVAALPAARQTLLFSATQTRSIEDLARLSLDKPVMVSVHEHSAATTPDNLTQSYIVTEAEHKLNVLWSFLKYHRRKKTIVFLASCKQTKYYTEMMSRLKPGMTVMGLYGTLHQLRRMAIYDQFCAKEAAVLFATDIAARGLDFPNVDWVVQLDCPEDAKTYTHRAGRTARYQQAGEALLVLTPSEEEGMLRQLGQHKVPIGRIEVNPAKQATVERKMAALLAADKNLKESAQRAFNSYVKSVFLMKNKAVFDVESIELAKFAESLGLASAPRVRFLDRRKKQKLQQQQQKQGKPQEEAEEEAVGDDKVLGEGSNDFGKDDSDDEDEDIFTVKRKDHTIDADDDEVPNSEKDKMQPEMSSKRSKQVVTKAQVAKKLLKKKIQANNKTSFDESGEALDEATKQKLSEAGKKYEEDLDERLGGGIDINKAKKVLTAEDKFDKATERSRIKEKHREEKRKRKAENRRLAKAARGEEEEEGSEGEGSEPDISWLPDPDKLDDQEENEEKEVEEEVEVVEGKRKKTIIKKIIPKKARVESEDEGLLDTGLSLGEDEYLAMQLLRR
jgi:ATP-dependent RNA helicase DDX10/DBP4